MKIGVLIPQGWTGEYSGWDPRLAWTRTVRLAQQAEALGFESIWLFDHFHTTPEPTQSPVFESFVALSALAAVTSRVRLGHLVLCAAYRNPALTAKMISTLDVVSGGRAELGIGAGSRRIDCVAYGYPFPEAPERLARLEDNLEIIGRMLLGGRSTFAGRFSSVEDALNEPHGLQNPRVPIVVGGNGPERTWRLAARFADELNLDNLTPQQVEDALPIIRRRCKEVGREPASLSVSVFLSWTRFEAANDVAGLFRSYQGLGLSRLMTLNRSAVVDDLALERLASAAEMAGLALG
jgi:F420-dependent oxidoreductase-like protein